MSKTGDRAQQERIAVLQGSSLAAHLDRFADLAAELVEVGELIAESGEGEAARVLAAAGVPAGMPPGECTDLDWATRDAAKLTKKAKKFLGKLEQGAQYLLPQSE